MTLSVASRPIFHPADVSELGRAVLGFVDGGLSWLEWAIIESNARYHFADESELVAGVQSGLHASPFLLLPVLTVMVSPVKLMTISLADLRTLGQAEAGHADAVVTSRAKQILAAHGLVTQADFAEGIAFLTDLQVASAPLFQSMGFMDQLAILDLLNDPGADLPDYRREAAAFAVAQAVTPVEFCDYFRAYLQQIGHVATFKETPAERAALVQAALDTLLPLMFEALDCPKVEGLVAPWEVSAAIDEWLMMGRRLGFGRLSLGLEQVIANSDFRQQTGNDAQQIVAAYLAGAQALLKSAELGRGRLGQDGASCRFSVRSGNEEAVVLLGADGTITLASYRPSSRAA